MLGDTGSIVMLYTRSLSGGGILWSNFKVMLGDTGSIVMLYARSLTGGRMSHIVEQFQSHAWRYW